MIPSNLMALSIVTLTEDTGKNARAAIESLVQHILAFIVPGCRLFDRVAFLPKDPREEEAMRGSVWKSKSAADYDARVRLYKYIARRLREKNTFVVFHVDGDQPWRDRHRGENEQAFKHLQVLVAQSAGKGQANIRRGRNDRKCAEEISVELPLHHMLLLCPYRSIEAWLYQHIEQAVSLCVKHDGGRHVCKFRKWQENRGELDEFRAPEKEVCLGKNFNLELTCQGFPVQAVYDVGKSFFESVKGFQDCRELCEALAKTCAISQQG